MTETRITIEVVYALPGEQDVLELTVADGATVHDALTASGLLTRKFSDPALNIVAGKTPVGIYGERVTHATVLQEGDRVEIYRPLQLDPMQARRARAESQKKAKSAAKNRKS